MARSATGKPILLRTLSTAPLPGGGPVRRRSISPDSGRALEILGHAIEYLIDESAHRGIPLRAGSPEFDAVELLMATNREIYFACPVVPSFSDRFLRWAHLRTA